MNRPKKPERIIEFFSIKTPQPTSMLGLAGAFVLGLLGCQVVGGLEDLRLADGGAGGAGNGGETSGSNAGSSSSSSASSTSNGAPIMGDIACGSEICPIGVESACCSDHYKMNSNPFVECINGPPSNDGCNTAGGASGYETRIECQLPAHCPPGTVCCGNIETILMVATWYPTLSCTTSCIWPDTVVCDSMSPNNDCPIVNDNGKMVQTACATSELLPPNYTVCK